MNLLKRTSEANKIFLGEESDQEEELESFDLEDLLELGNCSIEPYKGIIVKTVETTENLLSPYLNVILKIYFKIKVSVKTEVGRKSDNEDRYSVIIDFNYYTKQVSMEHGLFAM